MSYNFDTMMNKVQQKVKEMSTNSDKPSTEKLPAGQTILRILPPWKDGDDRFYHHFGAHYVKSTERNDQGNLKIKAVALCQRHAFGENCDICNAISQGKLYAHTEDQRAALEESASRQRVLVNALILSGNDPYAPVVLELPASVFESLVNEMSNQWKYAQVDSLNLTTGLDFIINRTGKGLSTEYHVSVKPGAGTQIPPEVMAKINDLDAFVAAYNIPDEKDRSIDAISQTIGVLAAPQTPVGQLAHQVTAAPAAQPALSAPPPVAAQQAYAVPPAAESSYVQPVAQQTPPAATPVQSAAAPVAMAAAQPALTAAPAMTQVAQPVQAVQADSAEIDELLASI